MQTLRYGIIGGGFVSAFHLRALRQVRGVEVAGLVSRRPPEQLAATVRELDLGPGRIYKSIREMIPHVDVVAIFAPNFARVAHVEEIVDAIKAGNRLKGVICEKPLARNMAEGRRLVELIKSVDVPTAYFENQCHMRSVRAALEQLRPVIDRMGPLMLTRAGEEHAGPHNGWFWNPTQQGGGVLLDMGCHCISVGWYALTPPGKGPRFLVPQSVSADVSLLKWGQPRWREQLKKQHGVDYASTPAEDFATGIATYKNPETGQIVKGQFTSSWMFEKQGLRLSLDGIGPGYALEMNTLRSSLEVFVGDAAAEAISNSELALEKSTATRGLLVVQPNEADLLGYTDENVDAVQAFATGRAPLLDWEYGLDILRLVMAGYMSAEQRRTIDLTDAKTLRELDTYVPAVQQGRGRDQFGG